MLPGDMPGLRHKYSGTMIEEVAVDHRVKYRDVMNLKHLYTVLHDWVCEEGWDSRFDPAFRETFYLHRWTQNSGEELWIYWRLEKQPNKSSYYSYHLDIDWHVVGLRDYDLIQDGKKFKANYGEVELKIFSKVVADFKGKWGKDSLAKSLRKLFFQRTMHEKMLEHRQILYDETYKMLDAVKTYFRLRTYNPEPELAKFGWDKNMQQL